MSYLKNVSRTPNVISSFDPDARTNLILPLHGNYSKFNGLHELQYSSFMFIVEDVSENEREPGQA